MVVVKSGDACIHSLESHEIKSLLKCYQIAERLTDHTKQKIAGSSIAAVDSVPSTVRSWVFTPPVGATAAC